METRGAATRAVRAATRPASIVKVVRECNASLCLGSKLDAGVRLLSRSSDEVAEV